MIELLSGTCGTLRILDISSVNHLTDLSFSGLRRPKHSTTDIMEMNLSFLPIGDLGLISVTEGCKRLRRLNLEGCGHIGDIGVEAIGLNCTCLRKLILKFCDGVTDIGIRDLFSHSGQLMETLNISSNQTVGELSMVSMASAVIKLKELNVTGCSKIISRDFNTLVRSLINLETLHFGAFLSPTSASSRGSGVPRIDNSCLMEMSRSCLKMKALCLPGATRVSDEGIIPLSKTCAMLQEVDLTNCYHISDRSLLHLATNCPLLEKVVLTGCIEVTDKGLIKYFTSKGGSILKHLEIQGLRKISNKALQKIATYSSERLEYLNCQGCDLLTDEGIVCVAETCRKLQYINFRQTEISDISLLQFSTNCVFLKHLDVSLSGVTERGIRSVMESSFPLAQRMVGRACFQKREPLTLSFNKFVYKNKLKKKAAMRIEKFFVKYLRQKALRFFITRNRVMSTRIQAAFRGMVGRRRAHAYKVDKFFKNLMARKLQKWMRYIIMEKWRIRMRQQDYKRHQMAIILQSLYRGHMTRKRWRKPLEKFIKIIRFFRRLRIFKEWRDLFHGKAMVHVLRLQGFGKMVVCSSRFQRKRKSVVTLQRFFRFLKSSNELIRRLTFITQAHIRKRRMAAVKISNWYLRRLEILEEIEEKNIQVLHLKAGEFRYKHACAVIQRGWRKYRYVKSLRHKIFLRNQVLTISRAWRAYKARNILRSFRQHRIQIRFKWLKVTRGLYQSFANPHVRKIQRVWRKYWSKKGADMAGVVIQAICRGGTVRLRLKRIKREFIFESAAKIQRFLSD